MIKISCVHYADIHLIPIHLSICGMNMFAFVSMNMDIYLWMTWKKKRRVCYFICFFYFKAFFPLRLSVQIFNIIHYLIVPRVLSISSIYSVNSFILINCAVQAWRDCCNYERLQWTWVSCSNWFIPWWDKVHGHPRGTRSCYSREEGQNSTSHLWTRLNSCNF